MASIKIFLFTHKSLKDCSHPIVLQLIKDRKRKMITLGTAFKNQWNFESEFPNGKYPHTQQLKTLLKRKVNRAESAILELDDFGKPYTVDDIAEKIDMGKRSTSFKEYSNKLISQLKRAGKNGNARAYQDAQTAFLKFNKGKDID